jgi:hypothetical protein
LKRPSRSNRSPRITFRHCFLCTASFVCTALAQEQWLRETANSVPGSYELSEHGKLYPHANVDAQALWPGMWKEGTNGLRVELFSGLESRETWVQVAVGSVVSNSLAEYVGPPGEKFLRFELRDANGAVMPCLRGQRRGPNAHKIAAQGHAKTPRRRTKECHRVLHQRWTLDARGCEPGQFI